MTKEVPEENEMNYEQRILNFSDDELFKALKRRSYYTKPAANFAIHEAIKRGMIYSEQDLFDTKFKEEKMQFNWFPVPNNSEARKKIKRSLIRNLIITGFIPLVFGLYQLYRGESEFAEPAVIFGLVWILLCFILNRQKSVGIVVALFAFSLLGGVYLLWHLIRTSSPVIEFFIVIVLMLLVMYGLLFFHRITKADQED